MATVSTLSLKRQRQDLVDAGHRLGDQRRAPRACGLSSSRLTTFRPMLLGQRLQQLVLGDQAAADGDLADQLTPVFLASSSELPELVLVDEAEVDEHLADLAACRRCARASWRRLAGGGLRLAWRAAWPAPAARLGRRPACAGSWLGGWRPGLRRAVAGLLPDGLAGAGCRGSPGLMLRRLAGMRRLRRGLGSFGVAVV